MSYNLWNLTFLERESKREDFNMELSHLQLWSLCVALIVTIPAAAPTPNKTTGPNTVKPGCEAQCGNVTVPYPFGIGLRSGCALNSWYEVICATSYDPPKLFSPVISTGSPRTNGTMVEVLHISDTYIRVRNEFVAFSCYNSSGRKTTGMFSDVGKINYSHPDNSAPYSLSTTANRLMAVGCNDQAAVSGGPDQTFDSHSQAESECNTSCEGPEDVAAGVCDSFGCCEAPVPLGLRYFSTSLRFTRRNHTFISSWNPCGYAFVGEQGSFVFRGAPDLNGSLKFVERVKNEIPIVLEWVVGDGMSCSEAQLNATEYLCKHPNTECVDGNGRLGGYRCSCHQGYTGNPYLPPGCSDIDECKGENNCSVLCINTPGSYTCYCPSGYRGDGRKHGTGCKRKFPTIPVAAGVSFGLLMIVICIGWISWVIREKRIMRKRNMFFKQNGGFLLKQLLPTSRDIPTHIFTMKELMIATDNFSDERILGKGGYGTVYKGLLHGKNQEVAIKKSRTVDDSQIDQFINELIVLTRVEHPHVVKLLGCCLEAEVPLLIYEFVSNGTLYDQIHADDFATTWYSWSNCLRIAYEAAKALAYLHSVPIIHRDIKSTNILLDKDYTAKISDFGISRLIPMDKTRLSTLVQGTLGYLDPEYFFSSQLTHRSDVYSFGVVLAELLTRKPPLLHEIVMRERNLSMYFVESMKAGCLLEIIEDTLVKEAPPHQLIILGELIQSCLNVKGDDRPSMQKVLTVLEDMRKFEFNMPIEIIH